jgi:hypothetical protein
LAACKHGDRVRVVGRSRNGRMWAGLLCPVKDPSCNPEWIPDTDVFAFWKDQAVNVPVSSNAKDDSPQF